MEAEEAERSRPGGEGAERDRLWARMVGVCPPYEGYQRRTERKIPVMVLEPVAE